MFSFGKKKDKMESSESRSTNKAEKKETITQQNGVYTKRTYTEVSMSNETQIKKVENITSVVTNSPFSNTNRRTIFSSTFPAEYDANSFRRTQPIYRSVYTREPFSNTPNGTSVGTSLQEQRRISTPVVPTFSRIPPTSNETKYLNTIPISKSQSESALEIVQKPLDIKVVKSKKFYDGQPNKVPTYETHSKNRGQLLLINNVKFAGDKEHRLGAEVDEKNCVKLFKQIGFKISVHRDKKKSEMENIIRKYVKNSSLKNADISVVVVMSHGTGKERSDSTEIVGIDNELLPTTWILNEFDSDNCRYLRDKPKIFIFQCCRGSNFDRIQTDSVPFELPIPARKYSDMLVAYSTVPGFVSHRHPEIGTWYIRIICEVFMEHAHDTDVESMLKMADAKLASFSTTAYSRQTSSYENRGFKNCFLHPI